MKVYEGEEADGKLGFTGTVVENGVESNWDNGIKVKKLKNPTKLGKSAEETIFKAISLKLDLSKMDYNTEGQYPHVKGTSGYKDPKKKLPTAPKNDIRRLSDRFDESHNYSKDEKT
jgi:hypothetical protein